MPPVVQAFRHLLWSNHGSALLLIALALTMKVLLPAGFMPMQNEGRLVVSLCSGMEGMTAVIAIPLNDAGSADGTGKHGSAGQAQPCLFSGHSAPSLAAVDPALLALAVLFTIALAQHWVARVKALSSSHLRPPLRAPPFPV